MSGIVEQNVVGGNSGLQATLTRLGMTHTVPGASDPTFTRSGAADYLRALRVLVQPGPLTRPVGGNTGHRHLPSTAPGDPYHRSLPSRGPRAGPGRSQRQARLVGKADPRAQPARDPFTAGH